MKHHDWQLRHRPTWADQSCGSDTLWKLSLQIIIQRKKESRHFLLTLQDCAPDAVSLCCSWAEVNFSWFTSPLELLKGYFLSESSFTVCFHSLLDLMGFNSFDHKNAPVCVVIFVSSHCTAICQTLWCWHTSIKQAKRSGFFSKKHFGLLFFPETLSLVTLSLLHGV